MEIRTLIVYCFDTISSQKVLSIQLLWKDLIDSKEDEVFLMDKILQNVYLIAT